MSDDLVSIVVPCYQQGHLLAEAVDSALSQRHSAIEVIVVNDGSTDDTEAVANSFGNRVRYIAQANSGLAAARNVGIDHAAGCYVMFLDSDDLLDSESVSRLAERLKGQSDRVAVMGFRLFSSDRNSGEDILPNDSFTWFEQRYTIDPLLRSSPHTHIDRGSLLPYLFYMNLAPVHAWLCPTQSIRSVGKFRQDLRMKGCEDLDLWLRLAISGVGLATVPYVGALYRRYEGSMSSDRRQMLDARAEVLLAASRTLRTRPGVERWVVDLLQAARGVRRRYAADGPRSPLEVEISEEIQLLQRVRAPGVRSWAMNVWERAAGPRLDRLAVSYYRRVRPELVEYYRSSYG